jgi:Fe-S-cluster containining protein
VFISQSDLGDLCEYLPLDRRSVIDSYCRWVPFGSAVHLSLQEKANKDCVFWKDGGCSVYPARPTQCRTYPFWNTIVDDEQHWNSEADECPGIGLGPAWPASKIAEAVLARRRNPPMVRE